MRGQAELVHVISSSLTPQRLNEYRYEVVTEQSDDFQKVDVAYAERGLGLRAGHFYEVRFNDQHKTPRIVELLEEIDNPLAPVLNPAQAGADDAAWRRRWPASAVAVFRALSPRIGRDRTGALPLSRTSSYGRAPTGHPWPVS
jgi:hypothetical protein